MYLGGRYIRLTVNVCFGTLYFNVTKCYHSFVHCSYSVLYAVQWSMQ